METARSEHMPTLRTQPIAPVKGVLMTAILATQMEAVSAAWLLISGSSSDQGACP